MGYIPTKARREIHKAVCLWSSAYPSIHEADRVERRCPAYAKANSP
jgi:hypothetical protein